MLRHGSLFFSNRERPIVIANRACGITARRNAMFVLNTEAPEHNFAGTRVRMLISGKDTAGVFCMMEIFGPPRRATPLHVHDREGETIMVLEGVVDVTIDGRQVSVQ